MSNSITNFQAAIASHILGAQTNVRLRGSSEQVRIVAEAINSSKALYEELNNPDTTMEKVSELLEKKHQASKAFQDKLGAPWVL
jgi:hypothetical protein